MIQNSNANVLTPKPTGLTTTPQRKLTGCYVSPSKIKNVLHGINPFEVCPSHLIRDMVKKLFCLAASSVLDAFSFLLHPCDFILTPLIYTAFALLTFCCHGKKLTPVCNEKNHLFVMSELLHFCFK